MFNIPKKWCPGYEEVGHSHQVPHLPQHLCTWPPPPPPCSRLLHHRGQCEIAPSWQVTDCKTYKQNFTLVHYCNKLSAECVKIKCTVQYTCNLNFMWNVSNTYCKSHVFWVSVCMGSLNHFSNVCAALPHFFIPFLSFVGGQEWQFSITVTPLSSFLCASHISGRP